MKLQMILHKLGGYYLIPHELLHVLVFCIISNPCKYQWGNDEANRNPIRRATILDSA